MDFNLSPPTTPQQIRPALVILDADILNEGVMQLDRCGIFESTSYYAI